MWVITRGNIRATGKSTFRAACCLSRSTIYCDEDTRRSQEAYIGVLCTLRLRAVVRKVNGRHVAVEEFFPYFFRTRAALLFMSLIPRQVTILRLTGRVFRLPLRGGVRPVQHAMM